MFLRHLVARQTLLKALHVVLLWFGIIVSAVFLAVFVVLALKTFSDWFIK